MSASARYVIVLGAPLAMPWPGPHVDRYVALLTVLVNAFAEGADIAFWGLWVVLWLAYATAWLVLLSLVRNRPCPRHMPRTGDRGRRVQDPGAGSPD